MTTTSVKPPTLERRFGTVDATAGTGLEFKISGLASSVDTPYSMGSYSETIRRGAFDKSLAGRPDVMLLANHEGLPLARTTIPAGQVGHLSLSADASGLRYDALLDRNDPDAVAVHSKVRSGLLDQSSFAFRVVDQTWSADHTEREIREVDLSRGDVSVVNFGANPNTPVTARNRPGQRRGVDYYPHAPKHLLSYLNEQLALGKITRAQMRTLLGRYR